MSVLHAIQHWIHDRPVVYVVWSCAVVAALAFILVIVPRALRRLLRRGDRAPKQVGASFAVGAIGLGVLVLFLSGGRIPFTTPVSAATERSEFRQSVTASAQPFSLFASRTFNLALSKDNSALGVVPEVVRDTSWIDLRGSSSFAAPLVGLPDNLNTVLYARAVSRDLRTLVSTWQKRVMALKTGHVYVDSATARLNHISVGDTLKLSGEPGVTYWTVQKILPTDLLLSGRFIVMPLSRAQTLASTPGAVTDLVVFVSSQSRQLSSTVRRSLANHLAALTAHTVSPPHLVTRWTVIIPGSGDWTRRIAFIALGLVLLSAISLLFLGRRRRGHPSQER